MASHTLPSPPAYHNPVQVSHTLQLPTYTALGDDELEARIQTLPELKLPILRTPTSDFRRPQCQPLSIEEQIEAAADEDARKLEYDIVAAFFRAISCDQNELVSHFVSRGLVSPDVTNSKGETPLLRAVEAGKTPMVSTLVALGATVNAYGIPDFLYGSSRHRRQRRTRERTPLMFAAQLGRLALVKVLMEDYGADDAMVAPDGAIALRLAASNGHREVVEYLPARHAGAALRFQSAAKDEWAVMVHVSGKLWRVLRFFILDLPVGLLYTLPKHVCQKAWKRRHRFGAWCKRTATGVAKGIIKMPGRVMDFLRNIWRVLKRTPEFVKRLARRALRFLRAIPGVVMAILRWVGHGIKTAANAILNIFTKAISLVHTAVCAVLSFFRSITPKDVWNGMCALVRAIFVEAPLAIIKFLGDSAKLTYKGLVYLLGSLGQALWFLALMLLHVIIWTPKQIWKLLEAFGRLNRKGFNEIMALFDPKRM